MLRWNCGRLFALVSLVVVLGDASLALAQSEQQAGQKAEPEMADPSERQLLLNDDAVRAIIKDDYAGAVALLEEARSLGELNVTYLNLGRAYQMLAKCQKARDAFARALEAPRVRQPPAEFVEKKVTEYLIELDEQCPKDAPAAAPGELSDDEDVVAPPQVEHGSNMLAWTVTLTGASVLAAGGTMLALAASEADKIHSQPEPGEGVVTERTMREASDIEARAHTYGTIGVAALAGGAVISGVGAYLFWADDSEAANASASVSLDVDKVQLQWRVQF